MTLLLVLEAAGCVAVALIVLRMLLGRPPRRLRPAVALGSGFVGVVGLPIAALAAMDDVRLGGAVAGAAIVALAVGIWAARGPGERGDDGRLDWDAFDRERERWERAPRE